MYVDLLKIDIPKKGFDNPKKEFDIRKKVN